LSKAALAAERRGAGRAAGGADTNGGASSEDEDDSGADSEAEGDEAAAEDATLNARERDRAVNAADTDGLTERARDRKEIKHAARMKQQGLSLEEEDDDYHAAAAEDSIPEGDEGKASDAMMDDGPRELTHREKMSALFDKKKDDKYMTFHADDPLKPNPSQ
jgi:hypothetical protein